MTDVRITGNIEGWTNVRNGPRFSDTPAGFWLRQGDQIEISGFTIDPNASESKWEWRYRFERDDETLWCPAHRVSVLPTQLQQLPFVEYDGLENPTAIILKKMGIVAFDDTSLEDAVAVVQALWDVPVRDREIRTFEGAQKVASYVDVLAQYAVRLGSEFGGEWEIREIEQVVNSVRQTAKITAQLVRDVTGVYSETLAFQMMYGPLTIRRNPRDSVNPSGRSTWYARNSGGYEIILGDLVFFEGERQLRMMRSRGIRLFYTTEQLIAHEIAHVINFRYNIMIDDIVYDVDDYYEDHLQNADGMASDAGYGFAARSSDEEWETVTDAIANYNMDALPATELGEKRREQMYRLLKATVDYNFQHDDGIGTIERLLRWRRSVLERLQDAILLMDFDAIEKLRLGEAPTAPIPVTRTALIAQPKQPSAIESFVTEIRQQFPTLQHSEIAPHFTLFFLTLEGLTLEAWEAHLAKVTVGHRVINFAIRCALVMPEANSEKYHVFLVPDEGLSQLVKLHDEIYTDQLAAKLRPDIPFIPHITVGYSTDVQLARKAAQAINNQNVVLRGVLDTLELLQDSGSGFQMTYTIKL